MEENVNSNESGAGSVNEAEGSKMAETSGVAGVSSEAGVSAEGSVASEAKGRDVAGIWKRILGGLIDVIVLGLVGAGIIYFFGTAGVTEEGVYSANVEGWPAAAMFVIWFVYYVGLEAVTGKTVGKYALKMKVVNAEGGKISWGKSIVRNLMRAIDGFFGYLVGFIAILASKENQRLGDMAAKTYVVKE